MPAALEGGGTIDVMLQDPGAVPFVEGDYADVELHVDDSGANFISGTILITGSPLDCGINDNKEVSIAYPYEQASVFVRHGTLSKEGGSSLGSP